MTTINDIGDLVRVLQEQPQWAEALRSVLLTRELLELPERFAKFVETTERFMETTERFIETTERFMETTESFKETTERFMEATARNFEVVNQRFDVLEHDLADFKAETSQRFDRMDRQFDDIGHTLNQMNGRMDNEFGAGYESKADKNLLSFAGQPLQLRDIRVLNGSVSGKDRGFIQRAEEVLDEGRISWDEYSSMMSADLIFTGLKQSDRSMVYAVAEASITAGDRDVQRVVERARILGVITGEAVLPLVISANIGENQRQLAENLGVTMLRYSHH